MNGGLTLPARPSGVGIRARSNDRQGVEMPWTLSSAQNVAKKNKTHQKTPISGVAQERVMRTHDGGG